jgi:membrane peptidoglycan carboxypeptidase
MNKLLSQAIKPGSARRARNTDIHAAGKTGTSSDTHDVVHQLSRFISRCGSATSGRSARWAGPTRRSSPSSRSGHVTYEVSRNYPNPEIWHVPEGSTPGSGAQQG